MSSSAPRRIAAAPQDPRHHEAVADHDGQRHRFDDHHGGRRRQAADEGQHGHDSRRPGRHGQRQHEHVGAALCGRQEQQAGHGDRHDEDIDEHEVEREQPGGAPHLALGIVLDHGDVELARQQNDAHEAQERDRQPRAAVKAAGEEVAVSRGLSLTRSTKPPTPPNSSSDDEDAEREEGRELDQRIRRRSPASGRPDARSHRCGGCRTGWRTPPARAAMMKAASMPDSVLGDEPRAGRAPRASRPRSRSP